MQGANWHIPSAFPAPSLPRDFPNLQNNANPSRTSRDLISIKSTSKHLLLFLSNPFHPKPSPKNSSFTTENHTSTPHALRYQGSKGPFHSLTQHSCVTLNELELHPASHLTYPWAPGLRSRASRRREEALGGGRTPCQVQVATGTQRRTTVAMAASVTSHTHTHARTHAHTHTHTHDRPSSHLGEPPA